MDAGLPHYLLVSAVLFCIGIFCVLGRRNAVSILMGIELILNSANLNLVAFNFFLHARAPGADAVAGMDLSGHMLAIFVIVLAACEAAVFLAILMALYQRLGQIDVDQIQLLKG